MAGSCLVLTIVDILQIVVCQQMEDIVIGQRLGNTEPITRQLIGNTSTFLILECHDLFVVAAKDQADLNLVFLVEEGYRNIDVPIDVVLGSCSQSIIQLLDDILRDVQRTIDVLAVDSEPLRGF